MKSKNVEYIPWIDHLRCFGAILIILYHGVRMFWHYQKYSQYPTSNHWLFSDNPFMTLVFEGHTAVALFMIVSGFLLVLGTYKKHVSYFKFVLNRILRIYPLFLFVTIILAYFKYKNVDVLQILWTLLTFGRAPFAISVPVSWAVAVEFQFYLIFPLLLILLNKKGIKWMVGLILFFIILRFFAAGQHFQYISYWTIWGRIDQFLIGMILGVVYKNNLIPVADKMKKYLFAVSCFTLLFSLYISNKFGGLPNNDLWKILWPTYEAMLWAFFIFTYASVANHIPRMISLVLESVGKISYSIFLTHFIIIQTLAENNFLVGFSAEKPVLNAFLNTVIIVMPLTFAVSYFTHNLIEKPFLKLRVKYTK